MRILSISCKSSTRQQTGTGLNEQSMLTRRFNDLPDYAFPRLRALLDRDPPGAAVVDMSIGEPKHAMPDFVPEILAKHSAEFSKYPPIDGTAGFREAVAQWYAKRFGIGQSAIDPHTQILPLNGTREGLFMAVLALAAGEKNGQRAAILMPNPFYQCYAAAALSVGAEPVFVPATEQNGWMPDFASLPEDILARTSFAFYCSPSNPQGAVAEKERLMAMAQLAEAYDFIFGFDECYSEIYRTAPPDSGYAAAIEAGVDPENVLVFNSLSKRSNLAGLRSGFVLGGVKAIAQMKRLRSYGGAPNPLPAIHVSEACWRDETHVEHNRALYRAKFDLADEMLGGLPGYNSPEAGFFLWLNVLDGEAGAKRLWQRAGVRCLPGSYLGRSESRLGDGTNPGAEYLRAALVAPPEAIKAGLSAIAELLDETHAQGART